MTGKWGVLRQDGEVVVLTALNHSNNNVINLLLVVTTG